MKKAALLSVSDRTGLVEFADGLKQLGYELLTSSGTGKALNDAGIESIAIEKYTGQKEILGGRVKTLHPKLYAGLLYRRGLASDEADIEGEAIFPIDVVAVNLYPFSKLRAEKEHDHEEMTELIDIGGPSMIRAASKNHQFVLPVIDPSDYPTVLNFLSSGKDELAFRRRLSAKVLLTLAADAGDIASYLAQQEFSEDSFAHKVQLTNSHFSRSAKRPVTGQVQTSVLVKAQSLRYGENPHQAASFYKEYGVTTPGFEQLHGKELSYNNMLDTEAVIRIVSSLPHDQAAAVIVKHTNPCGVALRATLVEALKASKLCDPRSHFGGVIAFNKTVDEETAQNVREDFAEIIVAPEFEPKALALLKGNKNLRLIKVSLPAKSNVEVRQALGGTLMQEGDNGSPLALQHVAGPLLSGASQRDLELAWCICPHVKSNAIVAVKDGLLVGVGAGQMSRIDSVELCIAKAKRHGHDLRGAAAASDAFFPFPDSVETLGQEGFSAVVAPSGAKRDADTIDAATKAHVALFFATTRHFRH